jgi:hypothetical protein
LSEPLAICYSAIAMIVATLMFRSSIRKYNSNPAFVDLATVITLLGTPAWHYGRTLFNEPYLCVARFFGANPRDDGADIEDQSPLGLFCLLYID